jgi:ferric-dicitrate binding protein FerR (iron transport regulator)
MSMKENQEEYIYRVLQGECTGEEKEELERWLDESGEHRRVYDDVRAIARAGDLLRERERLNKGRAWASIRERLPARVVSRRLIRHAVSICLPFLLATGYLLLSPEAPRPAGNDANDFIEPGTTRATLYLSDGQRVELQAFRGERVPDPRAAREIAFEESTNVLNYHDPALADAPGSGSRHKIIVPRGGEYPLILPDGTRVWLNAGTEMEFPLAFGESREVRLSGEAFFEVKKENERPFIVHAGDARVEVTGTSFNLSCYPDDAAITATVETGSVSFVADHRAERLEAGARATYDPVGRALVVEEGVDLKYHSSWRRGQFYFYNTPLREITEKLGRWYDVQFEFADPSLEALCFSGAALRAKPIEFILGLLERTRSLQFTVLHSRLIRVEQK